MKLKIITWNINRAAYTRRNFWDYLNNLDFDIGLFQEVYMIPYMIRKKYYTVRGEMNAILIKKCLDMTQIKKERIIPNDYEIDVLEDFYVSAEMNLVGKKVVFISVYNYIGPNDNEFFKFLENMLNYIRNNKNRKQTIIIIGGDFNMDERFQGNYKRLGLLAGKMKREFHQIGYHEILSDKLNQKRFTFISPANKKPYQLDYLFIPKEIKVNKITIGNKNEIFNQKPRLSDHLPIIATIGV